MKSNKLKINKKHRAEIVEALSLMTQIGVQIAVSIVLGLFAGRFLDGLLGTSPWLMLFCVVLGIVGAFRNIYYMITKRWK